MDFRRNAGLISSREQSLLAGATVAVAGCGGDGGLAAETLARMGVATFRLADPEDFGSENLNRQNGCDTSTVGQNKAAVIAGIIRRVNPQAEVSVFEEGITDTNIDDFVRGADLALDETEYTLPRLAVMLGRSARANGVPVLTGLNIGFGALVTSFTPKSMTVERYLGIPPGLSLDEVADFDVALSRWVPRIPRYADLDTFKAIASGTLTAPSVAPGVCLASTLIATEAFNHLTGRRRPIVAPQSLWVDPLERKARLLRWRTLAFTSSALRMSIRSRTGRNEPMPTGAAAG